MILIAPANHVSFAGATDASPERVEIANPVSGNWVVLINGFTISARRSEEWSSRVTLDGVRVKLRRRGDDN